MPQAPIESAAISKVIRSAPDAVIAVGAAHISERYIGTYSRACRCRGCTTAHRHASAQYFYRVQITTRQMKNELTAQARAGQTHRSTYMVAGGGAGTFFGMPSPSPFFSFAEKRTPCISRTLKKLPCPLEGCVGDMTNFAFVTQRAIRYHRHGRNETAAIVGGVGRSGALDMPA